MIYLKSSEQLAVNHGVKIMVYGRAGLGKTVLTATCPNPILISAESGLLSLRRVNLERLFGVNNPSITYELPVIEINTIEDLVDAEAWCRESHEARMFQTVCIDSSTEVAEVVLGNAKKVVNDPRQAYGELIEKMEMTLKAFRDLQGKHVYISAKERRAKDDTTGTVRMGPAMPGQQLGPAVAYLFDELLQLGVQTDPATQTSYRFLRTQPDFNNEAKDRSGALAEIEQPHMGYIINKILQST